MGRRNHPPKPSKSEPNKSGEWTDLELSAIGRDVVVKDQRDHFLRVKERPRPTFKGYFGLQLHGGARHACRVQEYRDP